ncbi:tyrosine-type recombinase/integrase [Mesorhizobium sp. CO1-1-9]|uniref:tyrosine-type recombinase/integrase n=1 Tax=Mesorhizobium sp. CO1-1-9 TaxID=2876630 RepID=UPI001CCB43A8|nr:site-specific integrase [Mesorhizobium sp. CO1-1-9]MBZ9698808.1 integrase arm-type DNA-binding domain-containing protein [Mesorhizobium sp. CO1-1-9]
MARYKLTAGMVKAAKGSIGDGGGLWLMPRGERRYWVFIYQRHGRRREMGLGPLDAVSLADAREKADEARRILHAGQDPFREASFRQIDKRVPLFGDYADAYIKDHSPQWRGGKTEIGWKSSLEVHAKGLRKLPVNEIRRADVVRVIKPIWLTKAETAKKTLERIAAVLELATDMELRTGPNPARMDVKARDKALGTQAAAGQRESMPYSKLPKFFAEIPNTTTGRALRLLILCGNRTGEARFADWSEVDRATKVWTIPAERMKEPREHRIPLTDAAIAALGEPAQGFVFKGARRDKPIGEVAMAKLLAKEIGKYTVHGFRTSFRTWAQDQGYPDELAEPALAHEKRSKITRAYARSDVLERRREMMEAWAAFCEGGPT